jgi:predicted dehydrogenase
MTQQLGVGVLGLQEGRTLLVALNHIIPAMVGLPTEERTRSPHARAVAGCDLTEDKRDAARAVCPDLFYTADYDEMLKRDEVDIVAIYTPDSLHGEHIERAFRAGKHVISTKPLVNSIADASRILQASRETGGKLLVGQSTRFFESFQRQRSAYEHGEVGELELVDAHYIHRMDWYYDKSPWAIDQSDWIFLGMSHPIDLIRWYLGPIEEVHAFGTHSSLARRYGVKNYDIYTANYRSRDGRMGRAMGHYGVHELPSARNAVELVLYGSDGTSMAQYHDMRYYYTRPDGTEVKEDMLYHLRPYYYNNETHGMHYGEFANYTEYFAQALLTGSEYSPNLEEGLETYCIMEATRQASREGRPVRIAPLMEEIGLEVPGAS